MPFIGRGFNGLLENQRRGGGVAQAEERFEGDPNAIGSELEARGLNEFVDADRRFATPTRGVFAEASQQGLSQAVSEAGTTAGEAFGAQESSIIRRQKSLGLNLTERQQKSQTRRLSLSRELAKASAKGATRRGFHQRAEQARRGAGALEDQAFAIEAETEIGLTNAAGQEAIRLAQEKANRKQARNSLIGSAIGIGAMMLMSDENIKSNKRKVSLLDKLKTVRVEKWKYVGEDTDHIGPYAQEFNDAFGVGQDDNSQIAVLDALGVTLGAVKELSEQVNG